MLDRRLYRHLVTWLGQWPARQLLHVVGSPRRTEPGWDGRIHPAIGIEGPAGMVLSVPPDRVVAARELRHLSPEGLLTELPAAVGRVGWHSYRAVFRYTTAPANLPEVGEWVKVGDPVVPDWLRPFGDEVLVVRDAAGGYLAGAGIKRHDRYGHELSVGTEPAARGQGLARRLVAQAARRVLAEGAVPTYLHEPGNVGSARVAEAAGFADRGWWAYGVSAPDAS